MEIFGVLKDISKACYLDSSGKASKSCEGLMGYTGKASDRAQYFRKGAVSNLGMRNSVVHFRDLRIPMYIPVMENILIGRGRG